MEAASTRWERVGVSRSGAPLSVAVIYGTCDDHERATRFCEYLVDQLSESGEISATWWRMSFLSEPKFSRAAARAVANSDVILFSLDCNQEPAPAFKRWLETWPALAAQKPQLITLLHPSEPGSALGGWSSCLKSLAQAKNLQFVYGPAPALTQWSSSQTDPEPVRWQTEDFDRIEPYSHWGLNE
jgi:hypothetical protein